MKAIGLILILFGITMLVGHPILGLAGGLLGLVGGVFGAAVGLVAGVFGAAVGLVAGMFGLAIGLIGGVIGLAVGLSVIALPVLIFVALVVGLMKLVALA